MISLLVLLKYSVLYCKGIPLPIFFDVNAKKDVYARFVSCFGLFVISSGSVGTTPGARGHALFFLCCAAWSVGAILRKVAITMMHWLTSELHRRLGIFHNAFKSASRYLWNIQWADWGTAPTTRQISQRGYKGPATGRHAGCCSPLHFCTAMSGRSLQLSYPGLDMEEIQ